MQEPEDEVEDGVVGVVESRSGGEVGDVGCVGQEEGECEGEVGG